MIFSIRSFKHLRRMKTQELKLIDIEYLAQILMFERF